MGKKISRYILNFFVMLIMVQLSGNLSVQAAETVRLKVRSGADITQQLQQALNDARDNTSGIYTIEIPSGKYLLRGPLKMYSNTCLSMKGVTLKRANDSSMLRLGSQLEEKNGYSGYSGFKNIRFVGGVWDGANKTTSLIRLGHAQNITFEGVTFTNVKDNHHMEMAAVKKVLVSGCTFKNYTGQWKSTGNREALQFDVMHNPSQFTGYDNYDDTPCRDVTVTDCTFSHVCRGVGTHSAVTGSYFENMQFVNNTFKDVAGYAIICSNYRNAKINNNKMVNCGSGIWFRTMAQNHKMFFTPHKASGKIQKNAKSEIKNNVIDATVNGYKNVVFGIMLYGEKMGQNIQDVKRGDYRLEGITVQGNKVTLSCNGYGIWLQGAEKNKIVGNDIVCNIRKKGLNSGGNGDGIRILSGSSNSVQKNRIQNLVRTGKASKMTGIYIENGNHTELIGNAVSGCSKDGICVKKSRDLFLKNNKSMNNMRNGIRITDNSSAKTRNNSASGNRGGNVTVNNGSRING